MTKAEANQPLMDMLSEIAVLDPSMAAILFHRYNIAETKDEAYIIEGRTIETHMTMCCDLPIEIIADIFEVHERLEGDVASFESLDIDQPY